MDNIDIAVKRLMKFKRMRFKNRVKKYTLKPFYLLSRTIYNSGRSTIT